MNNSQTSKVYDLEERTAKFGEAVIKFCQCLNTSLVISPLISQLIRSSTSIGANYMEANGASSRRDFTNKIYICKKETQETKHWLRMIMSAAPSRTSDAQLLWDEAHQLTLIFQKITSSLKH